MLKNLVFAGVFHKFFLVLDRTILLEHHAMIKVSKIIVVEHLRHLSGGAVV